MLKDSDLKHIATLLHPTFISNFTYDNASGPLAWFPNDQALVVYATDGYNRAAKLIKEYIKYVKVRDNIKVLDLEPALTMRALGVLGDVCNLELIQNAWREETIAIWEKDSAAMPGMVVIEDIKCSQQTLDLAAIKTVSKYFKENSHHNTAILRSKYYMRYDNKVMVPIRYDKDNSISNYCLDASIMPLSLIKTKLFKVTKEFIRIKKERPIIFDLHKDLIKAWAKHGGLIHSPAAAVVSCVGQFGIETGWSPIATSFNGIPTVVTVCKLEKGAVNICCTLDHRAWDGYSAGHFYQYLKKEIPKTIKEAV